MLQPVLLYGFDSKSGRILQQRIFKNGVGNILRQPKHVNQRIVPVLAEEYRLATAGLRNGSGELTAVSGRLPEIDDYAY